MSWFFGPKTCGISAHQPGTKPTPAALEGQVLTTRPPGKSQSLTFMDREVRQRVAKSIVLKEAQESPAHGDQTSRLQNQM